MNNVSHLGAGVITLQETHFKRKGKLNKNLKDFEFFEAIRKKAKGGTLIGAHKSLDPILIEEYSDDFELIVVEVKIANKDVRIMSGYGPQENWKLDDKMPFFRALEEEVIKAKMNNKIVYIQMDANSKLGPDWIEGDPHKQTVNGTILAEILKRQGLIVINGLKKKCFGTITRSRNTKKVKEESVIDFVIGCDEMVEMVESLLIDEDRKYVLTKYQKTKKGVKVQESDHNSLITQVKATWNKKKNVQKAEMYNLKDADGLKRFKEITSKNNFLSEVFENEEKCIEVKTKQFLKRLGYCLSQSFKKIRIGTNRKNVELENLFNKRRILRTKKDDYSIEKLDDVERRLSEICADDNLKIVNEACGGLTSEDGGVNATKLWQLKRKLRGIPLEPPTAMIDAKGNLITTSSGIEALTMQVYKDRLTGHKVKDYLNVHHMQREELCEKRLKEAQANVTPPWSMEDLNCVLRQLKDNKSRDPLGLANELFKPKNAGSDLKIAVLKLMNQMKTQQVFPEPLKLSNISSLYKNKGSRKDFDNYRGIFRVTILRSILDKLIYNDEYANIDEHLTDSNVGARRGRNIRDNIFVINAILNQIKKQKLKDIDIGIYDAEKCFDKLWTKECLNDLYENGLQNDKLCLLHKENLNAKVAIKTSAGITKRMTIKENIMQGTVWGSLMCTCTMDKLSKDSYTKPLELYSYKGVPVPPLEMVDDILTVTNVENTLNMNKKVNSFIEHKNLRLSKTKCHQIHIGKGHLECPTLKVHEDDMKESIREKYLGDIIDSNANIQATIDSRVNKGNGIVAEITSILEEIPFGKHKTEVAMKLREAMLLNGILFNVEAWHGITSKQIKSLEIIDESLLRSILKAHSKTPKEFLYLETGALPLRWVVAQRRVVFLKHIMERHDDELLKKVFIAQKRNPTQGDFALIVEKDLTDLKVTYEEAMKLSKTQLKSIIKKNAKCAAFEELQTTLLTHTKVKQIKYTQLEIQSYLKSDVMSYEEIKTLTSFRSNCTRGIRTNFKKMFKSLDCPLLCDTANPQIDSPSHILHCKKLRTETCNEDLTHIYGNIVEQETISKVLCKLIRKRTMKMELMASSLPGVIPDSSPPRMAAAFT